MPRKSASPRNIAVFTSGGDAPGMNAAIRAVVRTAIYYGHRIFGIYRGYEGMIDGEISELFSTSVSNIIHRGGTILKTARSARFMTEAGMAKAYEQLRRYDIDYVIALGGDGTFRGALDFSKRYRIPFVGVPCTIDNDLYGTDYTIGFDTAINTAMQAIDKIRDTAAAHDRLFFVEVMGRDAGFIAMRSGIATGAEAILIPEDKLSIKQLIELLRRGWQRQKTSCIVVVAEGDEEGGAFEVAEKVKKQFRQYETRVTVIGHLQRGGSPTCNDRVLASRLGVAAVEAALAGKKNVMVGMRHTRIVYTPFRKAVKHHQTVNPDMLRLANILSI
ncbi:MAG: 6-phosphofructokinase [Chitinophagales bacterium]|nr:6-phosphofructokinase [Chitinophagales bacterium]MDW8428153.1 6-phosphofructokinase [Chitinophagales bacterium]